MLRYFVLLTTLFSVVAFVEADEIELVGVGTLSGSAVDLSGQTGIRESGKPENLLGGISALEYSGHGHEYIALSDRGPEDGAVSYQCRFHKVQITVDAAQSMVTPVLSETVLLTNRAALSFPGEAIAFTANEQHAERLDPEGIRLNANGNLYISDEYGPHLIEFSPVGKELRRFTIPMRYQVTIPGLEKDDENPANSSGRACNRGMEGLALSRDGKFLIGIMQSPLLQDSDRTNPAKPKGLNCRILKINIATEEITEYLYHLDDVENKLNEIMAINDHEFLVIERDGEPGAKAKFKKIMKIDLTGASEIQEIEKLPANEIPNGIKPVSKSVYIDMLSPVYRLTGAGFPEKLESLTFGPALADDRQTLIVVSDNDFISENDTKFYVFALPSDTKVAADK